MILTGTASPSSPPGHSEKVFFFFFHPRCDKCLLSKNNRLIFKMSRNVFNLFQWSWGSAVSFIMHKRCPRESDMFSERWAGLTLMKRHLQFSLYVNYARVALSVSAHCRKLSFFSSQELALRYVLLCRQPLGNRGLDTFPRRVHLHHGWIMDSF